MRVQVVDQFIDSCAFFQNEFDCSPKEYIEKEFVRPNPNRFRVKTAEEMDNRK